MILIRPNALSVRVQWIYNFTFKTNLINKVKNTYYLIDAKYRKDRFRATRAKSRTLKWRSAVNCETFLTFTHKFHLIPESDVTKITYQQRRVHRNIEKVEL